MPRPARPAIIVPCMITHLSSPLGLCFSSRAASALGGHGGDHFAPVLLIPQKAAAEGGDEDQLDEQATHRFEGGDNRQGIAKLDRVGEEAAPMK
jgi:hypothetical protein